MKRSKSLVVIIVLLVTMLVLSSCQPTIDEEPYTYNGETQIDIDGRSFKLEDIPKSIAEETVVNNFKYSIEGNFEKLADVVSDDHRISLRNEEEQFNQGLSMQSYTIHEISTLSESQYNQEKLEDGKYNPLYYYGLEEDLEKYSLKEYAVVNVQFTQKHSEKSLELGPQWGDGTFSRNFLVGKSSEDKYYKIYNFGMM